MKFVCHGVRGSRPVPMDIDVFTRSCAKLLEDTGIENLSQIIKKYNDNPSERHEVLNAAIKEQFTSINTSLYGFGRNTPCIEVTDSNKFSNKQLIFDLGTGASEVKVGKAVEEMHIFFTHFHYDHVQGMPFFGSLYNSNMHVHFYSPVPEFVDYLNEVMHHPYFPVTMTDSMTPHIYFHDLSKESKVKIGELTVTWKDIPHPGGCYAYRVDDKQGKSFCYFSDVMLSDKFFLPSKENEIFLKDIDMMLLDASMSFEDSVTKKFFGHTNFYRGLDFAHFWDVAAVKLFHFNPEATLNTLPILYQSAKWYQKYIDYDGDIDIVEETKWFSV